MILHHVLSLAFLWKTYELNPQEYLLEAQTIVNVEISTVFLAVNHLIHDKVIIVPSPIKTLNQLLFVYTFVNYRIWDFYGMLIHIEKFPLVPNILLHGLFGLNLYWFYLICRKACNKRLNS